MRIWAFAVRRWQFTLVIFGLLVALGISTLLTIPRSEDPTFPFPAVTMTIIYPGATPADIERLVIKPIEDAINSLDNVKKIESSAFDGLASIHTEFYYGGDAEKKQDDVIREFDRIRSTLPADLGHVDIRKDNPGTVNIVKIALVSDSASYQTLDRVARDLKDALEAVPGVRHAEIWALPQPEVRVGVDLERLATVGVPLNSVVNAVQGQAVNVPGGAVSTAERRFNLRTSGSYRSLDEVRRTVVAATKSGVVRVGDVAEVSWATEEQAYVGRYSGKRAVFVTASQKDRQNVFTVRNGIYAKLDAFAPRLPADIRLERGFDQSHNVARRLSRLSGDFVLAIAIVALTLLPLGLRAAGVVMISIPLSLAIGLTALHFAGYGLNQLSIAGFVVALGLLVDDSIVVVENIARFLREGHSRIDAAILATDQIALAVLGCTATLMLGFLPLLFLPEGAGEFIRSLPAAVLFTIMASLAVALTVIPFLASRMLGDGKVRERGPVGRLVARFDAFAERLLERLMGLIHRVYGPALGYALRRPRLTVVVAAGVFVATLATVPLIGVSLFPSADTPQFLIRAKAPDGASLAATDAALRFAEDELRRMPEVRQWFTHVGHGTPYVYYNIYPQGTTPNVGEIFVELKDYDTHATPKLLAALRERLNRYPAARLSVLQFENGPPIDAPVAIRIVGPDLNTLRDLALAVERLLQSTPGTRDVNNPVRLSRTDLNLGIDTDKAALFGVSPLEANRTVRLAVAGQTVGSFRQANGEEYPITLRLPMQERPSIDALKKIEVASASGREIPLAQIANPHFETATNVIDRHNRERVVTVSAYTQAGYNTAAVTQQVLAGLGAIHLPPGYRFVAAGEVEASQESFGGILPAILVASFGILAVLVLEFGNFRSTLIVLGVIPLGISGALLGLLVSGYTLSFTAVIGMIALVGIEIKNSILLVDFTNRLRRDGAALDAAILQAGEVRFLPILLTSATAIGSLLPLALQGSGLYSPLAIVIIGGLLSSTLLARLVTPVMYKLLPPPVATDDAAPSAGAGSARA